MSIGKADWNNELNERWSDICRAYHFDERIKWKYAFDGVYDVRECVIIDVDNTLTRGPTLTENWLSALYKNPEISKESSKINEALKFLRKNPWEVKEAFDTIFLRILKKVPLKESVYVDACLDAAANTAPPPRTRELMRDLYDMGLTRGVMTYGVEDALKPWYKYRVDVPDIELPYLRGTKLIFRNGYLDGYDMGGPFGKSSFAPYFVSSLGYNPDQVLAVDDDPIMGKTLAAMLGASLMIWVDKDEDRMEKKARGLFKYPGKTPIVVSGVEKNMQLITEHALKWKRYRYITETKKPLDIYHLNREFENMKRHLKLCKEDEKNTRTHMEKLIKAGENVINIGSPLVATIFTGVDDLFSELRMGFYRRAEPKELITTTDDLCSLLEQQNPELQLTKDYLEEMLQMLS